MERESPIWEVLELDAHELYGTVGCMYKIKLRVKRQATT